MKKLEYEEVHCQEYRIMEEARASIQRFLEHVYNEKRLHSALGYRPSIEFEQQLRLPRRHEALYAFFSGMAESIGLTWAKTISTRGGCDALRGSAPVPR